MGQPKTAPPSDVVAVVEGTPPDTAVGADAMAMVVVIAGGPHMRGRGIPAMRDVAAVATSKARRVNMVAVTKACRLNTVAVARARRLNTRIIPPIAVMVARAGDRTLSVTITVAAAKAVPGNLRAGSLPVAAAVGSGIAPVADARPDDAKRSSGRSGRDHDDSDNNEWPWVRGADGAVSPFGVFGVSCPA
jgi:hypothetical protein